VTNSSSRRLFKTALPDVQLAIIPLAADASCDHK